MKKIILPVLTTLFFSLNPLLAQDITVDEIIDGYFENTGGKAKWSSLEGIRMKMKLTQEGFEIPIEFVRLADGRQYTKVTVQGNEIFQEVYDGETLWETNFASMTSEKSDTETTENFKLDLNDFPESLLNYREKGYTAELMGTETIDGAETYKIKLTKEPQKQDGEEVEDISFYYFDTEAFVPIAEDKLISEGSQAGKMGRSTMSDYQEVGGFYFPFSMTQGIKDGESQPINIESIDLNPEVDETLFKYPRN